MSDRNSPILASDFQTLFGSATALDHLVSSTGMIVAVNEGSEPLRRWCETCKQAKNSPADNLDELAVVFDSLAVVQE